MIIHQITNSFSENYNGVLYCGVNWDNHLHRSFEVIISIEGSITVTVGAKEYEIRAGESVFIPPFSPHSIRSRDGALFFIAVFSADYVDEAAQKLKSKRADSYKFKLSEATGEYVMKNLCPDITISGVDQKRLPVPKRLMLKSCLLAICSEFIDSATLTDNKREDSLVLDALNYIEAHYLDNVTLKSMSSALGYSSEHVSRVFNTTLGINFKSLVNQYRLEHALKMIKISDDSLVSIAMNSGFQSLRSFNRSCLEITGMAPSQIKKISMKEEG